MSEIQKVRDAEQRKMMEAEAIKMAMAQRAAEEQNRAAGEYSMSQRPGLAGQGAGRPQIQQPVQAQPGLAGQGTGMDQTIRDLSEMIVSGNREDAIRATQFAQEDPQMMEALKPAILARQQAEARQMVR